ncbi:HET-domain-containing protein [Acephala macrosclerotiorum]|nr:HET-domain-containing protein [Acephala macrosclerotiorum]
MSRLAESSGPSKETAEFSHEHIQGNSDNLELSQLKTCKICRHLDESSRFPFRKDHIRPDGLQFLRSLDDLKKSCESQCRFCSILLHIVEYFSDDLSDSTSFTVRLWGGHTEVSLQAPRLDIEIYSPKGFPLAWQNLPILKDINPDPASDESFDLVKSLLVNCNEKHDLCKRSSPFLPKRVLDVEHSPNVIKLVETEPNSMEPYVALSYCWGPNPNFTTTLSSLDERKFGIEILSLPKALRDAVTWTRRLGVRYLWIDALCIIQDSKEDWEIESAKMASIYEQAYVTVCGASSPACDQPFLVKRDRSSLTVECLNDNGQPTIVKARKLPRTGLHDWSGGLPDVWDMRSWTMQEKILSTRLVSYSGEEIQWICKTMNACECERGVPSNSTRYLKSIFQLDNARDAYLFWHGQVVEYTRRRLTCAPDKLPAISGIASVLHRVTGSEYIAGVWTRNLVNDLCWERVDVGEAERRRPSWVIPPSYRAPSFSWASVDGAVFYNEDCLSPDWTGHAIILDISIRLSGKDRFGQVDDASINLRGPIFSATLSSRQDILIDSLPYYDLFDPVGEKHEFLADVQLQQCTSEENVHLIRRAATETGRRFESATVCVLSLGHLIYRDEEETWYVQYCLVLGVSSNEPITYERLGLISFLREDSWDWKKYLGETEYRNITIV